jgi:hypothetical protein
MRLIQIRRAGVQKKFGPPEGRRDETLRAPAGARVRAAQRTNGLGSRTAHGNGTAFSAVAPSERPVLPSIDPYSGVAFRQARHSHPTFRSLIRFRADLSVAKRCDPFATYRRVTHSPASTICRCITRALNLPSPHLPGVNRNTSAVMIASAKLSGKRTSRFDASAVVR